MKQMAKRLIGLVALLIAFNKLEAAQYYIDRWDEIPMIIGADFEWTGMRGYKDWANKMPKNYQGANLYVGARPFCYLGLELGYNWTNTESRAHTFATGETFFGLPTVPNSTLTVKAMESEWHFDVLTILPVADCFDLFLTFGWGSAKPKIFKVTTTYPTTPPTQTIQNLNGPYKGMFRTGIGAQYMATEMLGIRAVIRGKGTKRLVIANPGNPAIDNEPFRTSYIFCGGVFAVF